MSNTTLTDGQQRALRWFTLPGASSESYRTWTKMSAFAPDKRALISCVNRGFVERIGQPSWERYAITDLGRSALSDTTGEGK